MVLIWHRSRVHFRIYMHRNVSRITWERSAYFGMFSFPCQFPNPYSTLFWRSPQTSRVSFWSGLEGCHRKGKLPKSTPLPLAHVEAYMRDCGCHPLHLFWLPLKLLRFCTWREIFKSISNFVLGKKLLTAIWVGFSSYETSLTQKNPKAPLLTATQELLHPWCDYRVVVCV